MPGRSIPSLALGLCCLCLPLSAAAQPANLALGKPVNALTDTVSGQPADVVDGDPATVWWSYQGNYTEVSFVLDLGRAEHFTSVVQFPRQTSLLVVEFSLDAQRWEPLHQQTLPWPGNAEVAVQRADRPRARFFRYTGSNAETAYAGVGDFQVFDADGVFTDGFEGAAAAP